MRGTRRARSGSIALALVLMAAVAAVSTTSAATTPAATPYTSKQWSDIIAKAKQEGIRHDLLEPAPGLPPGSGRRSSRTAYGIYVTVNRRSTASPQPRSPPSTATGKPMADIWVQREQAERPRRPQEQLGRRRAGARLLRQGVRPHEVREARQGVRGRRRPFSAWAGTRRASQSGSKSYADFLNPNLSGARSASPIRRRSAVVRRLVPLAPGELREGLPHQARCAEAEDLRLVAADAAGDDLRRDCGRAPHARDDPRSQGAGRADRLQDPAQGCVERRVVGMVLKKAPHPNAAQLFANYLVTAEGQGLVAARTTARC